MIELNKIDEFLIRGKTEKVYSFLRSELPEPAVLLPGDKVLLDGVEITVLRFERGRGCMCGSCRMLDYVSVSV